MSLVGNIIAIVLQLFMLALFIRMILSFIPLVIPDFTPRGPMLVIFEAIYTITDPPIKFFDRFLPPLRLGSVAFSLGFICTWVSLLILQRLNALIFF